MFNALRSYLNERRHGVTKATAYVGGAYFLGRYISARIEDVRTTIVQERTARENLRRRFDQSQEDISFTVMALLPTLGAHILQDMDVEGVTQELQSFSKPPRERAEHLPAVPPSESSVTSTVDHRRNPDADIRSDNGSVSVISSSDGVPTELSASSASWDDQFSMPPSQISPLYAESAEGGDTTSTSPKSSVGADLSDSMLTSSSISSSAAPEPLQSFGTVDHSPRAPVANIKTKLELWREVKMLTFTRTLTVIYSITLLSLFTHIQLSVLGRSKYIQSLIQQERDERTREELEYSTSVYSLFWGNGSLEDTETDMLEESETVGEETAQKYLTLSWWILHVGWKDVGERVRRGVEEVFEGVSLKTKLTAADVHRLINDVRRRVEYEVTFEGKERRINFLSTLLPPTSETLQHVLTQGGIPQRLASARDPKFDLFLNETRAHLASGSFERVLEVCLDNAMDVLSHGVDKHVFGSHSEPEDTVTGPEAPRERLAAMLPGLARWCHVALEGLPNELVDALADVREVSAFSAIIYTSYDDRFR
ncbi:Peroxin-3 [Lenzites betulinus]|nr:Peroxin-3 [Lenzites betulinus]